ncbi:MAG: SAM-dependent methyltransferase, partial [Solirubrobacteraceae bacterium]
MAIREALEHRREVSDAELDHVFPDDLRERSVQHWTPVEIAVRAAELLAPGPDARVLDVGSGAGKLCIVGALVTGATWWGVEQDATLVAAANHAAWELGVG